MTNTALTPQALSPIVAAQDLTEAELVNGIKTALLTMAQSFQHSVKSAIDYRLAMPLMKSQHKQALNQCRTLKWPLLLSLLRLIALESPSLAMFLPCATQATGSSKSRAENVLTTEE